jgi:hypothetical protein
MKPMLHLTVWGAAIVGLLALLLHPGFGILQHGLGTSVGLGLIGWGLFVEARKRSLAAADAAQAVQSVQAQGD